jgi:hypothetical protein
MQAINIQIPQENPTCDDIAQNNNTYLKVKSPYRQVDCVTRIAPYLIAGGAAVCGFLAGLGVSNSFHPPEFNLNSTRVVNYSDCISEHNTYNRIASIVASIITLLAYSILNCYIIPKN